MSAVSLDVADIHGGLALGPGVDHEEYVVLHPLVGMELNLLEVEFASESLRAHVQQHPLVEGCQRHP